ncbi:MAG TPA: hybrid sensor histidine kinase/response regulator [Lysobacter sp.]|jgi:two-component system chemotaxis sensor kinase CheA|nr:hybrid sensor histidine kinase/response regulator [Lysobacter sp.]
MDKHGKDLRQRLLSAFQAEAQEHLQALSSGLVALEGMSAPEEWMPVVEIVFRDAHSLKGAARAIDQIDIESICQAMESVFAAVKRGELKLLPPVLDVLNEAVDAVGKLLPAIEENGRGTASLSTSSQHAELLQRLERALKNTGRSPTRSKSQAKKAPVQAPSRQSPAEDRAAPANTVRITTAKLDAVLFQSEELLSAKLGASQLSAEIRDCLAELAILKRERAKVAPTKRFLQQAWDKETRRSGFDKADPQWRKFLEFMAWESVFIKSFDGKLEALAKSAEHDQRSLAAMVDGLLDDMKQALMLPVSTALVVFPKLVRDLARDQGKEVDLIVRGDELEIDRRILEELRDPLVHLARNSIDHGIEMPEARRLAGKPSRGTLAFTVSQRDGNKIEIVIADDGAGIDTEKVREVARKLGVIPKEDFGDSEDLQQLGLIFHSGVSTSPIITDISGRGLGLAIVREKVERLGGVVSVETTPGQGTIFRMVVPLTRSTFRGVRVRVDDREFVLPTTHVVQGVSLRREAIKTVENRETIPWNGQALSLVHLADALELPGRRVNRAADDTVQAVILGAAGKHIAFGVDEIVCEQEVLVKPLGRHVPRVRNIAGATVLATGKVALILDVPDLLRSAAAVSAPALTAVDTQEVTAERKSILVAEDSVTSRALLKNILESAGYMVATAVDGIDGLTRLKTEHFDLVVSDIEMPRMNGFDFTAKIRTDKALARLPVVLVTALESREHRELGIDAGANAYVVKSSFDQSNLLDIVRRLI